MCGFATCMHDRNWKEHVINEDIFFFYLPCIDYLTYAGAPKNVKPNNFMLLATAG